MVSTIILAYNRSAEVSITLTKLQQLRSSLPFEMEIIVVDNASTDNTSELVKKQHRDVTLITRVVNNGVAGWNDGFSLARYPYLLVLDDDSHVENGLVESVNFLETHPDVGILGFNIVDQDFKGDPLLDPNQAWKHLEKIPGFIGCGAVIRKSVYEAIGGFAEWLFIYTHEFDYTLRALNAGYQTIFFETGTVVHRASKLNRTNQRLRTFGTRNELAIVYKHFRKKKSKYMLRVFLNNLKFMKREGWRSGQYVFKGLFEFYKLRNTLTLTPVQQEVQDFYAKSFWSTKPI